MNQNQVRIIGGKWRSRKIPFSDQADLRPTPDRVRETLFNWLMNDIQGAKCLDMFAGSGALAFEALSRGAGHVVIMDQSKQVVDQIKKNLKTLDATNATVIHGEAPQHLATNLGPYDIIFLDPPFKQNLLKPCIDWLISNNQVQENALIYIEAETDLDQIPIPNSWDILRNKIAGHVSYYLLKVTNP